MRNEETLYSKLPTVSIGMPVYNGEKWIARALDSLLSQTFTDFELIISDNASTDRVGEICREYAGKDKRIKYCKNDTNIGMAENFRQVLYKSKGKYFMWAAVDDWWAPDFVKALVNELETHSDAGLAMTALHRYSEDGEYLDSMRFEPDAKNNPNNMTYLEMLVGIATNIAINRIPYHFFIYGLYRTELLKSAMEIPIPQVPAPDRIFMCQIALATKIRYLDEFLHIRTVHRDPGAVRQADEEFIKIHNTDRLGYTRSWLAIEPYLWASRAIPAHRKCLIKVAADTFMQTNWGILYRQKDSLLQNDIIKESALKIEDDLLVIEHLRRQGFIHKAHELASALALLHPESPDLLTILAELKTHIGPKKFATKILLDVLKDYPKHSRALNDLAVILWEEGNKDDAIVYARDAVNADRNNIEANLNLAKMNVAVGNIEEAKKYANHVLEMNSNHIEALKILAACHLNLGDAMMAKEFLKRAEVEAPQDKEIKELLVRIKNGG